MITDIISVLLIVLNIVSLVALPITVVMMIVQIKEMRRSTYATAFKAVYDMLQTDDIREARRIVFTSLKNKQPSEWSDEEIRAAEKVCASYNAVGIMAMNGMVPTKVVARNWRGTLCRSWEILQPLVKLYREQREDPELWANFEWIAKQAKKQARLSSPPD